MAATERGLFRRVEGWRHDWEGPTHRVAGDRDSALAVTADGGLLAGTDGDWHAVGLEPEAPFVDVAWGASAYAITADGRLFVGDDGDWRSRALGLADATALAVA
jgi:hypothetical protein